MATVGALLGDASRRLTDRGVDTPRLDAEVLLAHVLGDCGLTEHHRDYRVSSLEDLESKLDDAPPEIGGVLAKLINDR